MAAVQGHEGAQALLAQRRETPVYDGGKAAALTGDAMANSMLPTAEPLAPPSERTRVKTLAKAWKPGMPTP